mmetsp:Transcript_25040/g.44524  ORF Transcript_25040/g.44524 Transcript_25040/m.44524 type:complete len:185 (-) Transcript_25040:473-1027(-)
MFLINLLINKTIITTCRNPNTSLKKNCKILKALIPQSIYINRGSKKLSYLINSCKTYSIFKFIILYRKNKLDHVIILNLTTGLLIDLRIEKIISKKDVSDQINNTKSFYQRTKLITRVLKEKVGIIITQNLKLILNNNDKILYNNKTILVRTYSRINIPDKNKLIETGPRLNLKLSKINLFLKY